MELKINGIYSTDDDKIIIILNYFENTNDILYLEVHEKLKSNSNSEVNKYYNNLKQTSDKEYCKYCKRKPKKEVEELVDGYLGQISDDNSAKDL